MPSSLQVPTGERFVAAIDSLVVIDQPSISVFFSYSHRDEALRDALETHLAPLKREGAIRSWHDRRIGGGREWQGAIDRHLESADLVLLLISPDFIASDYCFDREMGRALERHEAGEARVVPVILRPCDWQTADLARLKALPRGGKPITKWRNRDEGFVDIVRGLRRIIAELRQYPAAVAAPPRPTYVDDATREISEALAAAYRREEELGASGQDTSEVIEQILALRRRLRQGAQLKAGDFLSEGRFQLLEEIGQGGFAQVWKAYDGQGRTQVAVKVLHGQHTGDRSRRERFFRGARHMARLQHPNVVRVIEEACEDGEWVFFVMEYLGGGDFRHAVLEGRLSIQERLQIIVEVGDALALAHGRGVIHRDVKPHNILLAIDGSPKLTDFDLVRAADTTGGTRTAMLGTFLYASPEAMADARQAAEPADIYGLGMTAIFALHGADLRSEVLWELPELVAGLEAPPEVRAAIAQAVARSPDDRPRSMAEFCREVRDGIALVTRRVASTRAAAVGSESPARTSERSLEELLVRSIPWGDQLLRRLESDGAELIRLRPETATDRWHLQIRLPAELRDLYGTASEVLLLAAPGKIRGEDLEHAEDELKRREYDLDPDLLIVADGLPGLEDRLARIHQLWGQWVPWSLIDGRLPPLAEQFRPHLSVYDIFESKFPARGRQVIGRSALVADLSKRLQRGQSLGIFGMRKIGKTTLCHAFTDKLDPVSRFSKPERGLHLGRVTVPVIWLDVQDLCQRTLESLAAQLIRDLEERLTREAIDVTRPPLRGDSLEDLNRLLKVALKQAPWPIAVVFDEYDLLFESEAGEPAIPGIDQLFRMFRAHAQAQEPSRLAVVVIGRDSEFFDRPEMNGRPNPMLNWFVPRWLGPMDAEDADELLSRLGRRVGLDVGKNTRRLARRWTGGHPLLHRQLGSALLDVARGGPKTQKHIPTDPFRDEAIDRFIDRDHVLTTLREVFFLLAKRYPEAAVQLHRLSRAKARDLKTTVDAAGGWHRPGIRTLRKFGLLLGPPDGPYIPELLRWYSRTFVPEVDRIAV